MDTNRPYTFDRVVRIVLTLMVFTGIILLINRLGSVLVPFIIAVFIAYLLNPLVNFVERRLKTGRGLAVIIVVTTFIAGFVALLWWLIPTFLHEMNRMGQLITVYLQSTHISDNTMPIEIKIKELIEEYQLVQYLTSDNLMTLIPNLLPRLWSFLTSSFNVITSILGIFVIILYIIFLLIDFEKLAASWSQVIPVKYRHLVEKVATDMREAMRIYIRSQGTIALLVGVLMAIGFSIIGLPMAVIIGLFIGLLNFVPYLQLIGIPPALMLALLKSMDHGTPFWKEAMMVLIVISVVQAIQELVLNPRILGKAYSLNPALILLALSVWGSLLGVVGMMLALPFTTLIYSYYKNFIILEKDIHMELTEKKEPDSPTQPTEE